MTRQEASKVVKVLENLSRYREHLNNCDARRSHGSCTCGMADAAESARATIRELESIR